ncbi:class D sortase [Thermoactinomyces sp. AMNI-1]|uniref:Class D sortase n=1 Tax=Thermoactinomyces mirandus TaxID=2756294 RepID=A0A7W1XUZ2_9BACL|nr:class D sortase [Thermoactinomyces mirandus]
MIFITAGIFYAGYSGTNYLLQSKLVNTSTEADTKADTKLAEAGSGQSEANDWLVVAREHRPEKGDHFADLIIPKLQAKMPVVEGTHEDELEKGVGHYAESVLPGEPDNTVLSGHRDTVFRKVGQLKPGDRLLVQTNYGKFEYIITRTWITTPDDRTVIVPHKKPVLTLTTCYPFTYVGPAPERYIIQAEQMKRIE